MGRYSRSSHERVKRGSRKEKGNPVRTRGEGKEAVETTWERFGI